MANELKKVTDDAKKLWGKLTPGRRLVIVGGVVAVIALTAFLTMRTPTEKWAVLFSGLAPEDAGQIIGELKNQKVAYQIDANGTAVSVPEDKVHELRISLASAGIPRGGGVGFEIFDKQSFGSTSFVEQVNHLRALQGELQRTIMALDAVDRARVHIAMRERSLYRKEDEPPSASVVLKMRPGQTLSKRQVGGIVHLVASSVEGLAPGRVTVVDEKSNVISSGDDEGEGQGELEHTLAHRVEEMLARFLGPGHVAVSVTAEIDTSQTEKTEELVDTAKTALLSEMRTVEGQGAVDAATTGGIAGARGNLPGAPAPTAAPAAAGATGGLTRLQETKNYVVPRVVSRTVGPKTRVKRLHLAVLVDGKPGTGEPRGKEELAYIEALARESAGLEQERGDKIEVRSIPFFVEPPVAPEAAPKDTWPFPFSKQIAMLAGAGAGALLLLVTVTVLLLRRSKRKRSGVTHMLTALPVRVTDLEAQLPDGGAAPLALAGPSSRDRALDAARADAARAARVLGSWLAEPAVEKGGTK
jgi:flagellar M-ring protein FliF